MKINPIACRKVSIKIHLNEQNAVALPVELHFVITVSVFEEKLPLSTCPLYDIREPIQKAVFGNDVLDFIQGYGSTESLRHKAKDQMS